ncbi:MAG: septum formation initiator family protein [Eubacterium sp.]
MAEQKRRYAANEYVGGNVVRRLNTEETPQRVHEEERRIQKRSVGKQQERTLSLNGAYVVFLAAATVFCLAMCIAYINVQSQISEKKTSISSLENEITVLTSQNDALDYEINSYTDLDYIYKVATKKLGMVEASGSQVELYEKSDSEYMDQTGDIPTE